MTITDSKYSAISDINIQQKDRCGVETNSPFFNSAYFMHKIVATEYNNKSYLLGTLLDGTSWYVPAVSSPESVFPVFLADLGAFSATKSAKFSSDYTVELSIGSF